MKRAAFLDRDGVVNLAQVINGVPKPPTDTTEVRILEGVIEAISLLKHHNFVPVVVTNQPDIARGKLLLSKLEQINAYIGAQTGIEHFYCCIHDSQDLCMCRKPLPGLINQAAKDLNLDVSKSFLVGDRWRDIAAGQTAGCKCFYIDYSYPENQPQNPYTSVSSLIQAVQIMVGD